MSNNFVKRKGNLSDNLDISIANFNIKITASQNTAVILAELKALMDLLGVFSTSAKCLNYYITPWSRNTTKSYFAGGKLIGPSVKQLSDIAKKYYSIAGKDFLVFNGYDFLTRGNVYVYTEKVKNIILENVRYCVNKGSDKKVITELYNYQSIPEIIRDKDKFSDNDFYYAVGDGNYLFGKVNSLNLKERKVEILFVLYDEYNCDSNAVYFLKINNKKGAYSIVVETAAFKKLENNGLASPFLQFFVDTKVFCF